MKILTLAIIYTLINMTAVFACKMDASEGILPPNSMRIAPNSKMSNDMTSREFKKLINEVTDVYNKYFPSLKKGRLIVKKKWFSSEVNAYAEKKGDRYYITMHGGLARHPVITKDAFQLVVCHELGHHLGGLPRVLIAKKGWKVSVEGQSDYFATTKCLKEIYKGQDNKNIVAQLDVPTIVTKRCLEVYTDENEIALCQRVAMAGLSLANLFNYNKPENISFDTPDPKISWRTQTLHPKAQCRLDTYFQGSLCKNDRLLMPSFESFDIGYCTRSKLDDIGMRPLCWYAAP